MFCSSLLRIRFFHYLKAILSINRKFVIGPVSCIQVRDLFARYRGRSINSEKELGSTKVFGNLKLVYVDYTNIESRIITIE